MPSIDSLASSLKAYLSEDCINQVKDSYYYAAQAHLGQKRLSGEPYIAHPLAVSTILAEMRMDHQSLMAAMLHDVIEDTKTNKDAIRERFGSAVAEIVDGVSKLTHIHFEDRTHAQAENFQKMVLAMTRDIRVILVKLADRLHNIRTIHALNSEKRRRIAKETLDIYAPIAQRLGMHQIRTELEDLCFCALHPMRSNLLRKAVEKVRGKRSKLVEQTVKTIHDKLSDSKIALEVVGREKHLFSIYKKMKKQRKSFEDIMDVFGVRIVVETIDQCYRALGVIHNLFKPIPGRFKDYIAIPKANGYQSLHTTLFGLRGTPVEVQIRTCEMDNIANKGIAAHWLYKSDSDTVIGNKERTQAWLQSLLDLQKKAGNSIEFIENVKIDLFPDEVYVFSPTGEILELPKGATPIDFAYAVHTELGSTCVACRIDRKLASLSRPLESGQTLEIITSPDARPKLSWLNFVITGKAHSNIRHSLKNQKRAESIALGRRLLDKALASMNAELSDISPKTLATVLKESNFNSLDDLLEDLGLGNRITYVLAQKLVGNKVAGTSANAQSAHPLSITGSEGMVITFAKCCYPIPGDLVFGHVSSGHGLIIHTDNCSNIENMRSSKKVLEVQWDKNVQGEFSVELDIVFERIHGMVASLATVITTAKASIEKIDVEEQDAKLSRSWVLVCVTDRSHLAHVIKKLRTIRGVHSITRHRS